MLKSVIEYIKDTVAMFIAIFFQGSTKRFDKLNSAESEFNPFEGRRAIVTEIINERQCKVNFSGTIWEANLSRECTEHSLKIDQVLNVIEARGNVLIVSPK